MYNTLRFDRFYASDILFHIINRSVANVTYVTNKMHLNYNIYQPVFTLKFDLRQGILLRFHKKFKTIPCFQK